MFTQVSIEYKNVCKWYYSKGWDTLNLSITKYLNYLDFYQVLDKNVVIAFFYELEDAQKFIKDVYNIKEGNLKAKCISIPDYVDYQFPNYFNQR